MLSLYLIALLLIPGLGLSWWYLAPLIICLMLDFVSGVFKDVLNIAGDTMKVRANVVNNAMDEKGEREVH